MEEVPSVEVHSGAGDVLIRLDFDETSKPFVKKAFGETDNVHCKLSVALTNFASGLSVPPCPPLPVRFPSDRMPTNAPAATRSSLPTRLIAALACDSNTLNMHLVAVIPKHRICLGQGEDSMMMS